MSRKRVTKLVRIAVSLTLITLVTSCSLPFLDFLFDDEELIKEPVVLGHQNWQRATAITYVAATILEDYGYVVDIEEHENNELWDAVAGGSVDAMFSAWLPDLHGDFYGTGGEYTDRVIDMGINYEYAHRGLVVPAYMEIDSMEDLASIATDVDSTIVGIDPGAQMMIETQTAIDDGTYSLSSWTLEGGSIETMASALDTAIAAEESIVVTGWTPHWIFGRYDLVLLDDPDGVYGSAQDVHTIARTGLDESNPGFYLFLSGFDWTPLNVQEAMADIHEGATPADAARDFVDANQSTIDSLLPDERYFAAE